MMRTLRFYRSTEGIVVAMSLYVALAVGISFVWPIVAASPLALGVPFAVLTLVFGGAGLYLFADAVERVFDALNERFGAFFNEVMNA